MMHTIRTQPALSVKYTDLVRVYELQKPKMSIADLRRIVLYTEESVGRLEV